MSVQITDKFKAFLGIKAQNIPLKGVQAVLALHEEGATVPFIARYRKEKTGNLSEVEIRSAIDLFTEFNEITKRREFVLEEIAKQGNLTDALKLQLEKSNDLNEIEELYRPYKKKKKTKATLAREAGLGPLADWLWALGHGEVVDETALEVKAKEFINPAKGYATYEEALRGAQHVIIEKIANDLELRQWVRDEYNEHGKVVSAKGADYKTHSKYEMYAEFQEPVKSLENKKASHRYLAIRRGWQEGELKVTMEADEAKLLARFEHFAMSKESQAANLLKEAAKHALTVHVQPSITNEIHNRLKENADLDAIQVFSENVRRVLMSSPFGAKVVLGLDPGIRTGCKLALIDKSGHFISNTVVHIEGNDAKTKAKALFGEALKQIKIDAIAVGNGTGGREAEAFVRSVLKEIGHEVPVVMVSESGASVYSASDVAREEFPELDVTVRGAISIARRLQDPLAELVKIEPKSIGVGQYQHDVSQPKLKKSLGDVVESCVNNVGVDINTASVSLLQYVSGIGPSIAKNIVSYRKEHGLFKDRSELTKVPQLSTKAFEQAAGFLRILDGKMVLDRTGIHPERYTAVRDMASELGVPVTSLIGDGAKQLLSLREKWIQLVGEFTFDDIVKELEKPGRDPRDPFKIFQYREDIHELKDLQSGMICPGIVTNVTNFGAFVDIGVHQDGLVHISELSDKFIDDPRKVVSPGDQVKVRVLAVDLDRSQISLSMKMEEQKAKEVRAPREPKAERKENAGFKGGDHRGRGGSKGPRNNDFKKPAGGGGHHQPRGVSMPMKPKPVFNNPFAALSAVKDRK